MTNSTKKELKEYTVRYSVNGFSGFCCVKAKNKKQALKKFRSSIYICDVKEVE